MNLRDPRLGKWLSGCHMASGFIISAIFLHSSTNKNHSSNRRCFEAHRACLDSPSSLVTHIEVVPMC